MGGDGSKTHAAEAMGTLGFGPLGFGRKANKGHSLPGSRAGGEL